jgi:hypothetical protein
MNPSISLNGGESKKLVVNVKQSELIANWSHMVDMMDAEIIKETLKALPANRPFLFQYCLEHHMKLNEVFSI